MLLPRYRHTVLILTTFLLCWLIATPLPRLGRFSLYNFDTPPHSGEIITYPETVSFLQLWSELLQKDVVRRGNPQVSLANASPENGFVPRLTRWLHNEGWNVDRFFYVEQRLKAAVKNAYLRQNLQINRKMLANLSGTEDDKVRYAGLRQIIKVQEQQLEVEKVHPDELLLVSQDLYNIRDVLNGKTVFPRVD